MLFLAAIIWGFAFVAQSAGMDYVGPFTFNAVRCLIGSAVLVPVALLWSNKAGKQESTTIERQRNPQEKNKICTWFKNNSTLLLGGTLCGLFLGIATNLQQIGIMTTTVGTVLCNHLFITVCMPCNGATIG